MISYNRQSISIDDIKSVSRALKENLITRGGIVSSFENKISNFVNSKHAVTFNSASSALTAACFSLNINKNDIVWTVPNSFVSTASCALHFSARIDFVDIERNFKNISLEHLEEKLKKAKKANKLPKLLIPVHFAGQPTEQEKIFKLSKKFGFKIIEDASHSFGASRDNEPVGSCKWSDIVISSFHPVKTITTGEGGVACTNDKKLCQRLKIYRNNGIIRDQKLIKKNSNLFYYEQKFLGHNFHMPDINAALGISQLKRINRFIGRRKKIFDYYNKYLDNQNLILPNINKKNQSSYHLYNLNVKNNSERKKIYEKFKKKGIILNTHYIPIHFHPIYKKKGFKIGDFPNSEWHYKSSFSLPIFYDLKKKNLEMIISTFNNIYK